MAEDIKTSVENFNTDAQTAEEVVNGNESGKVVARLGREYPTLPAAIQRILDMGGMDAFATESALKASIPTTSTKIAYAADTQKIWRWASTSEEGVTPITGTWTDTGKSPIDQAKADATAKAKAAEDNAKGYTNIRVVEVLDERIEKNGQAEDLKQEIDAEGKIFSRTDKDGHLYITGLEGLSVQEKLKASPQYSPTTTEDVWSLEDPNGSIVARIGKNGSLYIPGINGSVQESISLVAPKFTNVIRDKKHFFIDEVQPYLNNLVASGMGIAPIPLNLMPSKYTVPNSIINSFKLNPPTGRLKIDTPYYKDDWVVHPFLIECIGTMRGYRYILAINPYTFEAHENPVIYGSNDLINFEMLTGFTQPLDTPPEGGFLSDSGFTYDPQRGELVCYWRVTRRPADGLTYTSYWCKRTKDLYTWTDKEQFFPELENGVDGLTSPAIIFDPRTNLWHLWNIKQAGVIVHRTAPTLFGPWSTPTTVASGTTVPWHIEVRWVGDKIVMLVNKRDPGSNYYLAISADGENWTFSNVPLFDVQMEALYKATFLPEFDVNNKLYLNIFYTTNHSDTPDLKRKLFNVKTNSVAI
ncbi:glycoside hydrolase family 43 protein [Acinetobacter radioresistens]|uniref:hypothetical protein n=1 Tax=Acinetobacter radioresistens TaxID=40216 RepID=UPI002004767F|nr:hypothetical protein [Acinetobacter radioresistens]MCK4098432.1 glycoside hydrolase family 43 protein [Acinetobacter radioresistens]